MRFEFHPEALDEWKRLDAAPSLTQLRG